MDVLEIEFVRGVLHLNGRPAGDWVQEVYRLRDENSRLAAGQCTGAVADEGGRPYCAEAARLQDEADLCRNDGASDIAALLDEAVEALRVERVVLAELALKTGELIEHLQKTGRLTPCFYMPALADARNVLAN